LRQHVGADTLAFLSVEGMMAAIGKKSGYCTACFTGKYPVDVSGVTPKETFELSLA
jgi:amidophosphoribosyltransferase